ncbi:hypothetical protein [Micromonospora sp. IBSANI012]|uniref:hypothetical protein n=1 Tax=Micromonospora sp. IBSANI012 TaxID=3457761 RepID=UPI0040592B85
MYATAAMARGAHALDWLATLDGHEALVVDAAGGVRTTPAGRGHTRSAGRGDMGSRWVTTGLDPAVMTVRDGFARRGTGPPGVPPARPVADQGGRPQTAGDGTTPRAPFALLPRTQQ